MSINANPLRRIATDLGWAGHGNGENAWSYERLVEHAVADYWRNRPQTRPVCGTRDGLNAHRQRGEKNCLACRTVQAQLRAIHRTRAAA